MDTYDNKNNGIKQESRSLEAVVTTIYKWKSIYAGMNIALVPFIAIILTYKPKQ